jgi:alkylation response protein AidB-like acyl-CoA dehydrogenase
MDNESFNLVLDTAYRWFAQHQPLSERIARFRDGYAEEHATWNEWTEMGWPTLSVSEEGGGFGANTAQCFELLRLAGRDARPEPIDLMLMLAAVPAVATRDDLRFGLADLAQGVDAPQFDSDAQSSLSGVSAVVYGGLRVNHALLPVAMPQHGGALLVSVALDAPGVSVEPVRLIDGRRTVRLRLVRAPTNAIGSGAEAKALAQQVIDRAAAGLVADAAGVLEAAFELTLDYLKQRRQFGRTLSEQQVLQHRMADIFCDLQQLLALTRRLAAEIDADAQTEWPTLPIAKSFIGRRALRALGQLIQVSGGIGMTEEYKLGHFYKRLHVAATLFGDAEHQLKRIDAQKSLHPA